jgi:cytochrome c-type biogenesis protein CcmH/NrfF
MLLAGGGLAALYLRRRSRASEPEQDALSREESERLRQILHE